MLCAAPHFFMRQDSQAVWFQQGQDSTWIPAYEKTAAELIIANDPFFDLKVDSLQLNRCDNYSVVPESCHNEGVHVVTLKAEYFLGRRCIGNLLYIDSNVWPPMTSPISSEPLPEIG